MDKEREWDIGGEKDRRKEETCVRDVERGKIKR